MMRPAVDHVASSNDSCSGATAHSLEPAMAERPGRQASQLAAPSVLANDRAGQSMHEAEVLDPVLGLNVPTGQRSHELAPVPPPVGVP